jgi:hypothetical protein
VVRNLLPPDDSEYLDPRPRLHRLTGDRCGAGILPRSGGGLPPVNVDHVAREFVVVGTDERGKRFAFDVLGGDQQGAAALHDGFEKRQQRCQAKQSVREPIIDPANPRMRSAWGRNLYLSVPVQHWGRQNVPSSEFLPEKCNIFPASKM